MDVAAKPWYEHTFIKIYLFFILQSGIYVEHPMEPEKNLPPLPWSLKRRFIVIRMLAKELRQNRVSITSLMEINLVKFKK